jgi:hypothetical protein
MDQGITQSSVRFNRRHLKTRYFGVCFALAAWCTPACSSSHTPITLAEPCSLNSDCSTGLICAIGRCRPQCVSAADCGPGGSCIEDGRTAGCQTAAEKNTPCSRPADCPVPLGCASDYRCRNLCLTDADCNVLGITGRVCAADAQGVDYCAESSEVTNGLLSTSPPPGALTGTPVSEPAGGDSSLVAQPVMGAITSPIGTLGGTLGIGNVSVSIPAGALDHEVVVTVAPIASPLPGSVGQAYDLGPTGTQFSKPVTVSFAYTSSELGGQSPSAFAVNTVTDNAWQAVSSPSVDPYAQVISGTTTHFSPYALVALPTGGVSVDAGAGGGGNNLGGSTAGASNIGNGTGGVGSGDAGQIGEGATSSGGAANSSAGATGVSTGFPDSGITSCPTAPGAAASPAGVASSTNTEVAGATISIVDGYGILTNSVTTGALSGTTYSARLGLVFTDYANALGYYQAPANKPGSRVITLQNAIPTLSSTSAPPQFAAGTYSLSSVASIAGYDSACTAQTESAPPEGGSVVITSISATRIVGSIEPGSGPKLDAGIGSTTNLAITFDVPLVTLSGATMPSFLNCCIP